MLCFLKDAEEKPDLDNRMRKWITDIRDVAYEAEDIIDNFILKVEAETPKKMGLKDCFQKYFCICSKYASLSQQANLYNVGQEINKVRSKLTQIQQNQVTYGIKSINDARERSNYMSMIDNGPRIERPYKDQEHVVGFEEDAKKLVSELVKEVNDRYVISIVGTGRLGKTTIARKLYNQFSPTKKFDCCAWVSVSTDYNIQDLLRSAVKSFKRPTTQKELEFIEKMNYEDLEHHLRETLKGHRYLVVLDDVWDVNALPRLMRAFPNEKNGSRVIMTTRNKEVAQSSNERTYVHELPFLNEEDSWKLFCIKAFPDYNEVGNQKCWCPPSSEHLAKEMVSKCRGLPLAIIVLGGLLKRKDPNEWPKLKEHMWSHVRESRNDDSNQVQHILALSFKDLPYRLKSCFLYLGLFPEDFKIDPRELCRLWVAEGFIQIGKESFEEEAEACLRELIDRSLIQVAKQNWRRLITCRVHDLLRDFAKELNFLHIYEGTIASNSRRLASHSGGLQRFVSLDHSDMRLRTLLFYNLEDRDMDITLLQPLCRKLRLLRVLGIGSNEYYWQVDPMTENKLPDEIEQLIHLRYLRLDGSNMHALSQFIGNLHALQTLELDTSLPPNRIQLPDEICKAKMLRHLIGHFKWPFRVDNLTNLQTLQKVYVEGRMEFKPSDLINLRELEVVFERLGDNRMDDNRITLDSIGGLRSLHCLEIQVDALENWLEDWNPEVDLHPLSHCGHLLQLRLLSHGFTKAHWKLPTEGFQLRYLSIVARGLDEDHPMPVLEMLPNLTILLLSWYRGKKLVCTAGGFPQLEILRLDWCIGLKEIQVEGGGMPVLKGLLMVDCRADIMMPERLRSIPAPNPPIDRWEWAY